MWNECAGPNTGPQKIASSHKSEETHSTLWGVEAPSLILSLISFVLCALGLSHKEQLWPCAYSLGLCVESFKSIHIPGEDLRACLWINSNAYLELTEKTWMMERERNNNRVCKCLWLSVLEHYLHTDCWNLLCKGSFCHQPSSWVNLWMPNEVEQLSCNITAFGKEAQC